MEFSRGLIVVSSYFDLCFMCKSCKTMVLVDFNYSAILHFDLNVHCEISHRTKSELVAEVLELDRSTKTESPFRNYYSRIFTDRLTSLPECPAFDPVSGRVKDLRKYIDAVTDFYIWHFQGGTGEKLYRLPENVLYLQPSVDPTIIQKFVLTMAFELGPFSFGGGVVPDGIQPCSRQNNLYDFELTLMPFSVAFGEFVSRGMGSCDPLERTDEVSVSRTRRIILLLRNRILSYNVKSFDGRTQRPCSITSTSYWCCVNGHNDKLCALKCSLLDLVSVQSSLLCWACCECCRGYKYDKLSRLRKIEGTKLGERSTDTLCSNVADGKQEALAGERPPV